MVTGSVAGLIRGVDLIPPGDLDITPSLERTNLESLRRVLISIGAIPQSLGYWSANEDGEPKWQETPGTPEERAFWKPDSNDPRTFDHLFFNQYGDFDVVPTLSGTYEDLVVTAARLDYEGLTPLVASMDVVEACWSKNGSPRREKDAPRLSQLRILMAEQ